jgi:hypothetical protein
MTRWRFAFAALAVAIGAVCSATAAAAPQWLIELSALTSEESFRSEIDLGTVDFEVSSLSVTILCLHEESFFGELVPTKTDLAMSITFGGCSVDAPSACKMFNGGIPTNQIKTRGVEAELIEGGGLGSEVWDGLVAELVLGLPQSLATVTLGECAAEGSYQIKGLACGRVARPETDEQSKTLTFGASAIACEPTLEFGTNKARLVAELGLWLTGSNLNKHWSVT